MVQVDVKLTSDRASTYYWAGRSPLVSWQDVWSVRLKHTHDRPACPYSTVNPQAEYSSDKP